MGTVLIHTYRVRCPGCGYDATIKLGASLGLVDAEVKARRVHDIEKPDCNRGTLLTVERLT